MLLCLLKNRLVDSTPNTCKVTFQHSSIFTEESDVQLISLTLVKSSFHLSQNKIFAPPRVNAASFKYRMCNYPLLSKVCAVSKQRLTVLFSRSMPAITWSTPTLIDGSWDSSLEIRWDKLHSICSNYWSGTKSIRRVTTKTFLVWYSLWQCVILGGAFLHHIHIHFGSLAPIQKSNIHAIQNQPLLTA